MFVLNTFFFFFDHGVLGLNIIDLIIEYNKFVFFILQFIELLL